MTALKTILTGAAGLAAVAGFASPAAAQYYPNNSNGGILGAIINGVINQNGYNGYGYNGYGAVNDRMAVDQCARSVQARLGGSYGSYGGYGNYGNYGYNNGYAARGQIQQITHVERRSGGGFKVYGVASSNANANYGGYGGYGGYNGGAYADLKFNCKVDSRGRVTDVDIDRNTNAYNPYGYRRY